LRLTNTDLDSLALKLWIGGSLSYILWNKLIAKWIEKKWISIFGILAKKAWIIWFIWGVAIWSYSFYNKEHIKSDWFKKDVESAWNDSEKIKNILENYNNSISSTTIDWKEIRIIKYKEDTPLVIMDNKIYTFDIIDIPLLERIKNTNIGEWDNILNNWIDVWKDILKWLLDIIWEKNGKTKINWQVIDTTKIKIDWSNISIDNNKYSISELFSWIEEKTIEIDEDLRIKFKKWAETYFPEYTISEFWWKTTKFIKLKDYKDWKTLSLVEIWKIDK